MYNVSVTKIENNKQSNEIIVVTKDRHEADLAFEGTILGLRYNLKDILSGEIVKKNKIKFKYDKTIITVTLKED
jgi:hypothetical protein